ncbi:MAG: hypothetical protein ACRDPI_00305 [Nocardioidaceae bacterium]
MRRRSFHGSVLAIGSSLTLAAALSGAAATASPVAATAGSHHHRGHGQSCHLGHGVKHVISLVFDNVHFSRDNPNVPSDLEQMPHLLNFLEGNGTVFSNTHAPMIAHTADDSLTIYTGLYGDRHGQPLSNSYKTYNPDGTTDPAASFAYWTDPVADSSSVPTVGHDTAPTMVYSPTVPAQSGATNDITPAPWVPFTRAGCSVGDFSTANMVLENAKTDLPTVFGPNSPEVAQYAADPDPFKDDETTDYVGVALHCAQSASICANAKAVRFGQSAPSNVAVDDVLPTEPGGYHGYQGLFGAKYTDPQLGAGTPNVFHHGYRVTDANGNLVDLAGNEITNQYTAKPGFPGFDPSASQSLAYLADMQESGVPVTYGYISDLHEVKPGDTGCTSAAATGLGKPIGPGDACYAQNTAAYDAAFATFFKRLKADGITPKNTLFVISAEENDQVAGANAGRATRPTPAGCTGGANPCNYAADQLGELQVNLPSELSGTASAATKYDIEPQGASMYVRGNPAIGDPSARQLERDTAAMTGDNPYSGAQGEHIVKYQADATEERVLHMQTADPLRLPTYTMFPVPDYYFATSGAPGVSINSGFSYNHGYYSPNIDINWSSFVGPGVAHRGVDGPTPEQGNQVVDPNSTNTIPQASRKGTWVEETDLRPTMLYLAGLSDDYPSDGFVLPQALRANPHSVRSTELLGRVYQQVNSAVGVFATATLLADSKALAGGTSTGDSAYTTLQGRLTRLADARDSWAESTKQLLAEADSGHPPNAHAVRRAVDRGYWLLGRAEQLRHSVN